MQTATAVEEQSATTNEVTRILTESSKGVEAITGTIKTVASAAFESSEGAQQTLVAASELSKMATSLSQLVEDNRLK